jgi:two-component system, sensor histidine kinase YesM
LNIYSLIEKISRAFNNQKIKVKILSLYLMIIISSIGTVSYMISVSTEKQLKQNVYYITNEAINQINNNISDKFSIITEQLIKIKYDAELEHLINANISSISEEEKAEAGIHFKKIFDEIYSFANNYELIHSMIIYLDNGMRFQLEQGKYRFLIKKLSQSEIRQYSENGQNYCWLNAHNDIVFFKEPGVNVVSISAPLRKGNSLKALIVVNMDTSYLKKMIKNINLGNTGSTIIVSEDGYLASSEYRHTAGLGAIIQNEVLHGPDESAQFEYKAKNVDFLIIYTTIRVNGWKLAVILKRNELMRNIDKAKYGIICFTLVIILIAAIAAILIAYGLTKPINKLSELMALVERGNLDIRFNTLYNDEIGKLTRQFNSMIEKIKLLISEVAQEQAQKKKIELETLQMQIDPHFLYNTLDSIKFLAEQKSDDTSEMVRALGQFYRSSLSKGDGLITVAEEIDHLKNYLTIQKIRYSTQFDYRIEADDNILTCETIKFILQPLVENSIYHGVRKKREKGLISIRGYQEDGDLIFTVYDNGAGIAPDRLEQIRENLNKVYLPKESGIGVYNVHKRVTMRYGEEYGLSIDSAKNEFTLVKVKLPCNNITEEVRKCTG